MEKDKLDSLLEQYCGSSLDMSKLKHLEQDVWREINRVEAEKPRSLIERLLAVVFVPKYRYASVTFALVVGLLLGSLSEKNAPFQQASLSLNFDVFSSNYQHLPSTRLR